MRREILRNAASDTEARTHPVAHDEERRLRSLLEAVLFASPEPVTVGPLARALQEPEERIRRLLEDLTERCHQPERGLVVHRVGPGYRLGTKPEHHEDLKEILRGLRPRPPLSVAALQTLAIIAYKQPIAAAEIQKIRGVEGAGVLDTLLRRSLIARAGRRADGRQARLYKTTERFLEEFGLQGLGDLPSLETFAVAAGRIPALVLDAPLRKLRSFVEPVVE